MHCRQPRLIVDGELDPNGSCNPGHRRARISEQSRLVEDQHDLVGMADLCRDHPAGRIDVELGIERPSAGMGLHLAVGNQQSRYAPGCEQVPPLASSSYRQL